MLKNYLRFTFRNLAKNKVYAGINVLGLALGIVCALIIFLLIKFEMSFEDHHPNADRIYQMTRITTGFGNVNFTAGVPYPMIPALRNDFPEIEALTIVDANFTPFVFSVIESNEIAAKFSEPDDVAYVDGDYFKLFHHEWVMGDPAHALQQPHSMVISESIAKKFFGDENPMGKRLSLNNTYDVEITGIVKDAPENTDLHFNILIGFDPEDRNDGNWNSISSLTQCFLMLPENADLKALESRLGPFLEKYTEDKKNKETITLGLRPLKSIHFDTRFGTFTGKSTPRETLMALGLIGLFLILTACINFINLNTALAVNRAKEVGVRKVLGSHRAELVLRFLADTALVTLMAVIISIGFLEIALAQLQNIIGFRLQTDFFGDPSLIAYLFCLFAGITLLAGLYPALYLSRFHPIDAIRNRLTSGYGEGLKLRRGLVITQFAISQILIIAAIVISSQMSYLYTADMGLNRDAVLEVPLPTREQARIDRFRNQLHSQPAIKRMTFSSTGASSSSTWGGTYRLSEDAELKEGKAQVKFVDEHFVSTFELRLLHGSDFMPGDTVGSFIVNEAFAKDAGYGEQPELLLGKEMRIWGRTASIGGIVRNFHTHSMHNEIPPVIMMLQNRYWRAGIKIQLGQASQAIAAVKAAWEDVYPEYVLSYAFLDENIAAFYEDEQQTTHLMSIFTAIAILIGCMGLLGLVSYMAARRTKEIGIRKVLGAGYANILGMFVKEFLILILAAFIIAVPAAWFLMQSWLADYAYRIELGAGIFLTGFAAAIFIALVTVGYKSIRAAMANPVDALKYE